MFNGLTVFMQTDYEYLFIVSIKKNNNNFM